MARASPISTWTNAMCAEVKTMSFSLVNAYVIKKIVNLIKMLQGL